MMFAEWNDPEIRHLDEFYLSLAIFFTLAILIGGTILL